MRGFIFYRGVSVLDGAPIVGIATLKTSNIKTGNLVQTWILRDDISPAEAVKSGDDSSICGACPHRHFLNGSCYVLPFQAPNNIYKSYKKGVYKDLSNELDFASQILEGLAIRLGAYGDPAAIPFKIWDTLLNKTRFKTGYTHQINHKNFDSNMLRFCMASADTAKQAQKVQKAGFRTFRVKTENSELLENEVLCLSESKKIDCYNCKLCGGSVQSEKPNIAITIHGNKSIRYIEKFSNSQMIKVINI